ncbi:MAG TPA: hypothetical protein DE060_03060 [Lentisphaeria bacterium]|nr:hypothetical protein [Lentisphaeria bacterium]HCG48170.1 hypothetical protein [Lentisphaeria bacterium]
MNDRKCMVLLITVLFVPVLLVGYVLWNQHATVVTEEKKLFDKLCLKRTVSEESNDYAVAVKSLLEALELLKKQSVSDPDKGKLAIACEALCSACLHLKNDKEAEQYGLKALALKKELYGEWHLELFNIECLLGSIYNRLNKRDTALQHYSHARTIMAEEPEGVEPFHKIWLCRQLAELYFSINQQHMFEASLRELVYLIKIHSAHTNNLEELYTKLAVMAETHGKDIMRSFLPKMKKQADMGNPDAQFAVALWYSIGGVFRKEPDTKTAIKYFSKAAEQGDIQAQYLLGIAYSENRTTAKDMARSVKWSRKVAEQGDAEAQFWLGWHYKTGSGVAKDMREAVKWYRKAVEQEYAKAQLDLRWCYADVLSVTKDTSESVKWYRRAAEQGDAKAQYNLGWCYANGSGVAKDMSEAVKWWRKAAEQGLAEAQLKLEWCYAYGKGVVKDRTEALKWLCKAKAAELGEYHLGLTYANSDGVFVCDAETVKRLRKAAEQGNAEAQYNLGVAYLNGDGIARDVSEAVKWYRKAIEQGYTKAQYNLGCCYANGEGVTKNISEAVKWISKAAERGLAEAQYHLGLIYGDGVAKDMIEAVKWYRKAAEQGHEGAKKALSYLEK